MCPTAISSSPSPPMKRAENPTESIGSSKTTPTSSRPNSSSIQTPAASPQKTASPFSSASRPPKSSTPTTTSPPPTPADTARWPLPGRGQPASTPHLRRPHPHRALRQQRRRSPGQRLRPRRRASSATQRSRLQTPPRNRPHHVARPHHSPRDGNRSLRQHLYH